MELHRRCTRSNIPALVMLLLQLSVLLSGAAAGAIDKSETQVDEKEQRAEESGDVTLLSFNWYDDKTFKICIEEDTYEPHIGKPIEATLLYSIYGNSEVQHNLEGIVDEDTFCVTFVTNGTYPYDNEDGMAYKLIIDDADEVNQVGRATFVGPDEALPEDYEEVTCDKDGSGTVFYRVDRDMDDQTDCLVSFGFNLDSARVCYITIAPITYDRCDPIKDIDGVDEYEVCQTVITNSVSVNVAEDATLSGESLVYDEAADTKSIYFETSADAIDISEAIVTVDDGEPIVYRGTVAGIVPLGEVPKNTDDYTMCVVGIVDSDSSVVALGTGAIEDIDLNMYYAAPNLEFGFINKDADKYIYEITAVDENGDATESKVTLDCLGVTPGNKCFGFLGVDSGIEGMMTVAYDEMGNNAIKIPFSSS